MSWLKQNEKTGIIEVLPEAMAFDKVKAVYNADKTSDKKDFQKIITWIYHVYKSEHPLENLFPSERKKRVIVEFFGGEDVSDFEKSKKVQDMITLYKKDSMLPSERFYQNLQQDMEDIQEHLQSIKMTKIINDEIKITVEYVNDKGEIVETEARAKHPVVVDNSKEKLDVIKRADDLLQLEEKFRLRMKKERQKKENRGYLFDNAVEPVK